MRNFSFEAFSLRLMPFLKSVNVMKSESFAIIVNVPFNSETVLYSSLSNLTLSYNPTFDKKEKKIKFLSEFLGGGR